MVGDLIASRSGSERGMSREGGWRQWEEGVERRSAPIRDERCGCPGRAIDSFVGIFSRNVSVISVEYQVRAGLLPLVFPLS